MIQFICIHIPIRKSSTEFENNEDIANFNACLLWVMLEPRAFIMDHFKSGYISKWLEGCQYLVKVG